ncbi:MAG: hypothetical protein QOF60_3154 [Actinomycetota bacterium]|jgi:hypothetical protein|nr:hypothetical protein [Actinomycetota bacterium]
MLFGEGLVGLVVLAFWLWAIFDVISTDESLCRNLPKGVWVMVVLFLADIGALAWLLLGRPENAGFAPGDTRPRAPSARLVGPEDSPRWDARLDTRTGIAETPRERQLREMREHYAALDAELDRRLEQKRALGDEPPLDPA